MGQLQSVQHQTIPNITATTYNNPIQHRTLTIEHEGILKSRSVPFRDCIHYSEMPPIFMERYDATLQNLLEDRYTTNRLFTEDDLICLLESVLYTLAYLEVENVAYSNLSTRHIYYVSKDSQFKLHPIQLHQTSSFYAVKNNDLRSPPSPQMIVSIRAGQPYFDNTLQISSNLFCFGMIMLECLSLKSSATCYDPYNLDILDREIQTRLNHAQEFYSSGLLNFIRQMLVYDYSERVSARNLALLFNRQMIYGQGSRLKKVKNTPVKQNIVESEAEVRGSHIDKLSGLAEPPVSGSGTSYRDYVTSGKLFTDNQSMKSSNLSGRKRSVSPARIPGYKASIIPPMSQPCISTQLRQSNQPVNHSTPDSNSLSSPIMATKPPHFKESNVQQSIEVNAPATAHILKSKLVQNWPNMRYQTVRGISPSISNVQLANNTVKTHPIQVKTFNRTPQKRILSPSPVVPRIKFQYHNPVLNPILPLQKQQAVKLGRMAPDSCIPHSQPLSPSHPKPFTAHFQSQQKMAQKLDEYPSKEWTLQEGDSIARIRQQIEKSRKLIKQLELDTKNNI